MLANEVSFSYTRKKSFVRGFNTRSLRIAGVARGTHIQIDYWKGKVDITVALSNDTKF